MKVFLAVGLMVGCGVCVAQNAPVTSSAQQTQEKVPTVRGNEPAIDGFVRSDDATLAMRVPGKRVAHYASPGPNLELHDFSFDGQPVGGNKLHLRQLSDGVYEVTSNAYAVGEWQFRVRDAADGYFGLGEHFNSVNHTHEIVLNGSQDNSQSKGGVTYKPIPFYMSTTGYGLWVDTTAEAVFDMNASSREDLVVAVPAQKLRLVLFTGPEFPKILEKFTGLAGRQKLPPYWAFAPWIGRDYHRNDADVKEDIEKARQLGLPASVILIDSPWSTGYNSYVFNSKQWSDAPGMTKALHEAGFKLVLWHTSWINNKTQTPGEKGFADKIDVESSNYKEAAQNGYFVKDADGKPWVGKWWKGEGSLIDFTNPKAKAWWQGQVAKAVKAGADGFKDDDAEGNFQGDVKFADGTDPRLMRNKYTVLYNNAVEEVLQKELNGNGILFTRSATVGNQNLPFLWGGDNEASFSTENGFPTVVTAGIGAGMSGMSLWATDLGGYLRVPGGPDARLFMRWTEYSAFSPGMEVLGMSNLGPWDYGDEALRTYKKYSVLHMSLFPYRYAAAQESAKTGMPLIRALALLYQDDQRARESKDEYMFGPSFLVAPVVDENTSRTVYLPAGEWVNYWTGAQVTGGKVIVADAPLDVAPVYVKAGAVIAKLPEDVMTLVPQKESGNTTVKSMDDRRVYELVQPFADKAPATLTDFEGRTLVRDANSLKIHGDAAQVTVRWKFGRVGSVTVNGSAVKLMSDANGSYVELSHSGESRVEWK